MDEALVLRKSIFQLRDIIGGCIMEETDVDLIIPVYLNQRMVFDMIAMLQNGMSTVSRVTEKIGDKTTDERKYGAAFGLNKALSGLLKIDVHGVQDKRDSKDTEIERSEERVHTPASLFQKLRATLMAQKRLSSVTSELTIEPGMMVEFSTTLRHNPVSYALETFVGIIDIATEFSDKPVKKNQSNTRLQQLQIVRKQIQAFLDVASSGETIDLVSTTPLATGHRAVITLEKEYLNDPTMSDLVDGQFKILGKLVRVIPDSSDSVNLLRKRALGSLSPETLNQLFSALSDAAKQSSITVPEITYQINGPVLQTLPIAVFA